MQISLYFPQLNHPSYGVIRALVKDSSNSASDPTFLDSDGQIGQIRPNPTTNPDVRKGALLLQAIPRLTRLKNPMSHNFTKENLYAS